VNSHTTWTRIMDIDYVQPAPTFCPHTCLHPMNNSISCKGQIYILNHTPPPPPKKSFFPFIFMTTTFWKNSQSPPFTSSTCLRSFPHVHVITSTIPKKLFPTQLFSTDRSFPYWLASCFTPWPTTSSPLACCPLPCLREDPQVTHSFTHPDGVNSAKKLRYLNSSTLPILKPNLSHSSAEKILQCQRNHTTALKHWWPILFQHEKNVNTTNQMWLSRPLKVLVWQLRSLSL